MVKKEKTFVEWLEQRRLVANIFLGVGLMLFLINISSFLAFLPWEYNHLTFNISVFSSMIIILFAVYILHYEK